MGRYFVTIPDEQTPEVVWEERLSELLLAMERYRPVPRSTYADAEALVRSAWRLLYRERMALEAEDASERPSKAA
jgi:hypothetical protein